MAGTLALNVEILGEFKKLTSATQGAENSLKGLQDKVGGFATNITRIVGALGITLGFSALIQGAKDSVEAASDLEQQFGALDSIFKGNAEEMKIFAKDMNEIGLSSADAARQSSLLGAMLKGSGLSIEDTTEKTQDLVRLAGDLAATFGGPTSDAVNAISSLLRGERDPIERYGVSLKQLDIDAQMLEDAKNGLVFASEKEASINATLALLYDKTTDAQGQAARESDSYAAVTARLNAKFQDISAEIGLSLLPVLTEFSEWLQTPEGEAKIQAIVDGILDIIENLIALVTWVDDNQDWLVPMVVAIGTVTAAWNVATAAVNTFKAAAGLSAIAGVTTAVGAGTVGTLGVAGAGAAVGGFMQGEALAQQSRIYSGDTRYEEGRGLFGDAFSQNNTNIINVTTGATAQQIADALNRANRASGTNLIRGR
jgi:hypothetical protein